MGGFGSNFEIFGVSLEATLRFVVGLGVKYKDSWVDISYRDRH